MHDYLMTMTEDAVGVADLKSRLSEHLRKVRAGRTLVVLDRDTPIARIVPYEEAAAPLVVRSPLPGAPPPGGAPLPPALDLRVDVLELLREERQGDR